MSWLNDATVETAEEREKKRVESLKQSIRSERDKLIQDVAWRVERHNTQKALGITPTESDMTPVLEYIQALRDVTEQAGFPESVEWPVKPTGV